MEIDSALERAVKLLAFTKTLRQSFLSTALKVVVNKHVSTRAPSFPGRFSHDPILRRLVLGDERIYLADSEI